MPADFTEDRWATIYFASIARGCDHEEAAAYATKRIAEDAAEAQQPAAGERTP